MHSNETFLSKKRKLKFYRNLDVELILSSDAIQIDLFQINLSKLILAYEMNFY